MCGHPGAPLGEHDEGVDEVPAVLGGGGEVAADRAELLGSGSEAQVVVLAVEQAAGHMMTTFAKVIDKKSSPVGKAGDAIRALG